MEAHLCSFLPLPKAPDEPRSGSGRGPVPVGSTSCRPQIPVQPPQSSSSALNAKTEVHAMCVSIKLCTDGEECRKSENQRGKQKPCCAGFQQFCYLMWGNEDRMTGTATPRGGRGFRDRLDLGPGPLPPAGLAQPSGAWTVRPASPSQTWGHFFQGHSHRKLMENVPANWCSVSSPSSAPRSPTLRGGPPSACFLCGELCPVLGDRAGLSPRADGSWVTVGAPPLLGFLLRVSCALSAAPQLEPGWKAWKVSFLFPFIEVDPAEHSPLRPTHRVIRRSVPRTVV